MLILYLKKSIGLQNRDEQSNNNAKKVQKEDAGWHSSHKQEACLMAKDSVNLKSRHFPDISYSIFNKFTYPDGCSHFCFSSVDVFILSDDSLPAITLQKS